MSGHRRRGLACVEPIVERIWLIGTWNLARLRFVRGFEMAAATDMTIVDQSLARSFPGVSIYNIRAFADFVNAPTPVCAPILVVGVNAERT